MTTNNGRQPAEATSAAGSWALAYAARGWHVLPVGTDKRPIGGKGLSHATTDEQTIREWWKQWPNAKTGIACKASGLAVTDLDVGHADGADGIATLRETVGMEADSAPLVASTPKGGRHLYYLAPTDFEIRSRSGILPGVDVKAGGGNYGGYVIAPCGNDDRQWINGDPLDDLEPLPEALQSLLKQPAKERQKTRTQAPISTAPTPPRPRTYDRTDIASSLYAIPPEVVRDEWLRAIFAVHAACGGDAYGAELVEEWSAKTEVGGQYQEGEATKIYAGAQHPDDADGKLLVGPTTLFVLARRHGWRVASMFSAISESDCAAANPFPLTSFVRSARTMVEEGAGAQGVDPAFWAVPMLGVLAGCIGATRSIEINKDWKEPCVLWPATVAPSGAGKSPPLRELMRPVRDHDHELHRNYVTAQEFFEAEHDAWKKRRRSKQEAGQKPSPPPMLAAIVSDVTLEALVARLADNPRGLLLCTDELAGWLRGFDRYRSGGGDEQSWLSIHNADDVKVDRKGSSGAPQRVYVRNAAVSVVGTIQPAVAAKYIGNPEARASGLAARMLLAAPPVSAVKWTNREIPAEARLAYKHVIEELLRLELDEGGPRCIPLDDDARDLFITYHDENGAACLAASKSGHDDLAAVLSKLRGAAARTALVLALAQAAESGEAATLDLVSADSMRGGIAIARYFEGEARHLYAAWRSDTKQAPIRRKSHTSKELEERIRKLLHEGERTQTELHDAFARNVEAKQISDTLSAMKSRGEVDCRREETGGRPRHVWFLCEEECE